MYMLTTVTNVNVLHGLQLPRPLLCHVIKEVNFFFLCIS